MDGNYLYECMKEHAGHNVAITEYGDGENYSLECMDCCVVIFDTDCYDLKGVDDSDDQ